MSKTSPKHHQLQNGFQVIELSGGILLLAVPCNLVAEYWRNK